MTASVKARIRYVTQSEASVVFLRREFTHMASASSVSRALSSLCAEGVLWRIGAGVYARTRISVVTGALIPAGSLETLAAEALKKLGIDAGASRAAQAYNDGSSTQLPGEFAVSVGRRRITRQLEVGGRRLKYERT
ncbi:MAG: S-adenosylhomocysteine hydrolase [Alcaligenaceae bacterium]|nr:MAG: S-adenosylhomocysteine hydrolase [Alcaligenaceae bacterium]